jgi:serine phosphatase RsbU (regulator of sigma subunit)/anti-sigma regulatory factor (Ser/Thr protein kinase)
MLRAALEEAGLDELIDVVLLLGSELCDNAVLHAGTEFEVQIVVGETDVTVTVSDQGPGPLELHLALPRSGRAATYGRGLQLVERLAAEWGTRHDSLGRHQTWFVMRQPGAPEPKPDDHSAVTDVDVTDVDVTDIQWPAPATARWLLRVPTALTSVIELPVLAAELLRRLCELTGAEYADVSVEHGDGLPAQQLAGVGFVAEDEPTLMEIRLPVQEPLRGVLRLLPGEPSVTVAELAELTAQRVALSVESEWLRGADQRRRSWMSYLAEASELLAQSLDVELTVAMVPQLVVPRLGEWCAVHLVDENVGLRLAVLTHAQEDAMPQLRAVLEAPGPGRHRAQLAAMLRRMGGPTGIGVPADSIAVPLTARGRPLGTLIVGRGPDRAHSPEEIALISDLARRASLAIDNAQVTAAHIETSQALQQALLPRELPAAEGVEFAAEYLPASTASDVGGDFYDVLTLDPGRWLVSIGDVCGKGARAAARTGLVRDVLRVLVQDGRPLPRAIQLLNSVMLDGDSPELFCTVAAALVSSPPDGGRPGLGVELVLAGHERPVVVRANGAIELVGEYGTAVGLVSDVQPICSQYWLDPGDALVTYTDGVTERRRGTELFGQQRLVDALAAAAGRSAFELVGVVRTAIEGFSSDPRRDDVALLVVRAPG